MSSNVIVRNIDEHIDLYKFSAYELRYWLIAKCVDVKILPVTKHSLVNLVLKHKYKQ